MALTFGTRYRLRTENSACNWWNWGEINHELPSAWGSTAILCVLASSGSVPRLGSWPTESLCRILGEWAYTSKAMPLRAYSTVPFVRFPLPAMEALLKCRFSGVQWAILIWTVRHTHGWNRDSVAFSWYRIARSLGIDRSGVVRAGKRLILSGILRAENGHLSLSAALIPSRPVTCSIADKEHRNRGRATARSRRAIERRKERYEQHPKDHHPAGAARPVPGKYGAPGDGALRDLPPRGPD